MSDDTRTPEVDRNLEIVEGEKPEPRATIEVRPNGSKIYVPKPPKPGTRASYSMDADLLEALSEIANLAGHCELEDFLREIVDALWEGARDQSEERIARHVHLARQRAGETPEPKQ